MKAYLRFTMKPALSGGLWGDGRGHFYRACSLAFNFNLKNYVLCDLTGKMIVRDQ